MILFYEFFTRKARFSLQSDETHYIIHITKPEEHNMANQNPFSLVRRLTSTILILLLVLLVIQIAGTL